MFALRRNVIAIVCVMFVVIASFAYADIYEPKVSAELSGKRLTTKMLMGKTFYTRANMWFEGPKNFLSTNFHKGLMIPIGTKVKISSYRGARIKFAIDGGATYTYIHARKHSKIKLRELFYRYFSETSVMANGEAFSKLTKKEQENVLDGIIEPGMSKEAVLMAYGYPPTHRTPDLASNIWTYWESRAVKNVLYFEENILENTTKKN